MNRVNLSNEFRFLSEVYKSRSKNLKKIYEHSFEIFYKEKLKPKFEKILKDEKNKFSFFPDLFKEYIIKNFDENQIWRWCMLNASLQFQFIDKGYRVRDFNSQTLNDFMMNNVLIVLDNDKDKLINFINRSDVNKKKERINIINSLYDRITISSEVFTEDPLFKKGFLAALFYNDIFKKNRAQAGPCVDYHLMTWFNDLGLQWRDHKSLRLSVFYLIDKLSEDYSINFNEIDNLLFGEARHHNSTRIKFTSEDTVWY